MIGAILSQGTRIYRIVVNGNSIVFNDGQQEATINNLKLSKSGVIKEFPDLNNRDDWREEAIRRFKEKLKKFKTEDEKLIYLVEDLEKHGFTPLYKQRQGCRVEVWK